MKAIILATAVGLLLTVAGNNTFAQTPATPATPAAAQTPAKPAMPVVHERQEKQQQRIANGVSSGQLTAKETEHLEKREARIQEQKKDDKADGKITPAERKQLRTAQNNTSKAIYRQKHDGQRRH